MVTTDFIITVAVLVAAAFLTYIIQYDSVISPRYIEFDDRSKKELQIMQSYNKIMSGSFNTYLLLIGISVFLTCGSDNMIFAAAGMYIQIMYFISALIIMLIMYLRSRLYWKRVDMHRQIRCKKEKGNINVWTDVFLI